MAQVKAALSALYGADNVQRKAADAFLNDFQATPAAWTVADTVLRMEPAAAAAGDT